MNDPWSLITNYGFAMVDNASRDSLEVHRVNVAGIDTMVCRLPTRGLTTSIHPFIFFGLLPPGWTSREMLDDFNRAAVDYSIQNKGGMVRGMQTGTLSIPVAITDTLIPASRDWASRPSGRRFAALSFPVTVECIDRRINHPQHLLVGAVYTRSCKRIVRDYVTRVVQPDQPH